MQIYLNLFALLMNGMFCVSQENCTKLQTISSNQYLMTGAYKVAHDLFTAGRRNYELLKQRSRQAIDLFLDAVLLINEEMANEVRDAIIRLTKIKGLRGFDDNIIGIEEAIDISEHCLTEPPAKAREIGPRFHKLMQNFQDLRTLAPLELCRKSLPDEVAAAHCALHQAVLFNETMQENLVTIVETKTRQLVSEMNRTLFGVQNCFLGFVPHFFDQTLLQTYTTGSGAMVVLNAAAGDIMQHRWRDQDSRFLDKWTPVLKVLQERVLTNSSRQIHSPSSITMNVSIEISLDDFIKELN